MCENVDTVVQQSVQFRMRAEIRGSLLATEPREPSQTRKKCSYDTQKSLPPFLTKVTPSGTYAAGVSETAQGTPICRLSWLTRAAIGVYMLGKKTVF